MGTPKRCAEPTAMSAPKEAGDWSLERAMRSNAKKTQVGAYYTTKIYSFVCKCYECKNTFEIRNDPKTADYIYLNGIRKKVQEFDTEAAGTLGVFDTEDLKTSSNLKGDDAIERLEGKKGARVKGGGEEIGRLIRLQDATSKDDFLRNSQLRGSYRKTRDAKKARVADGARRGINLQILEESAEDREGASKVKFGKGSAEERERSRMGGVRKGSIFGGKGGKAKAAKPKARVKVAPPAKAPGKPRTKVKVTAGAAGKSGALDMLNYSDSDD
ncbi:hypothetical protein TeGR_g5086 [Tetraparma gracilis]|uniref:DUF572-domain-containing protein n=1 Tax=Tetraparma gracilis TaxID=2962635 RepID=A0ABQ6N3E1_9STRA|nr:hypothetical protein TeGR_g5086 [Tetraparma gracilis]